MYTLAIHAIFDTIAWEERPLDVPADFDLCRGGAPKLSVVRTERSFRERHSHLPGSDGTAVAALTWCRPASGPHTFNGLTVICGHIASRVGSLTLSCQGYYHPSTGSIRADWSVLSGTGDLEGCHGEGGWAAVVPLEEEERRFERLHGVEVQLELSFPGAATPAGEGGYPLKRVASRQKREQ